MGSHRTSMGAHAASLLLAVVQVAVTARPRGVAGTIRWTVGCGAVVTIVDGGQGFHGHQKATPGRGRLMLGHHLLPSLRFSRRGTGGKSQVAAKLKISGFLGVHSPPRHASLRTPMAGSGSSTKPRIRSAGGGTLAIKDEADAVQWIRPEELDNLVIQASMREHIAHRLSGNYPCRGRLTFLQVYCNGVDVLARP